MQARSFVLKSESIRELIIRAIQNLPVANDQVFEIVIRIFKPKRSNPQNNLYWVRLDEISEQAWFGTRQFDADTIHEFVKRKFLPEVTAKGVEKWRWLPDGGRVLRMSTTDLDTKEFSEYFIQVEAFAADLGVMMSDSRFYK